MTSCAGSQVTLDHAIVRKKKKKKEEEKSPTKAPRQQLGDFRGAHARSVDNILT